MTDKIVIIASVKPLEYQGKVTGRLVTDKAGDEHKVKKGQGGCLKDRWEELDNGVGNAICLKMDKYEGHDYVADFEWVKDVFVQEATEKVQTSQATDKGSSIETQVAIKEIGECWRLGKLPDHDALVVAYQDWLYLRLSDTVNTRKAYKEAVNEPNRPDTTKDKPITGQTSEQSTRLIPSEEDRDILQGIKELFGQDWTDKGWKSTKVMKYIFDFDNTSGGDINKVDLNKLEEQLRKENNV